jgi:hypothetical protein
VFQLDHLNNTNQEMIKTIVDILDLGGKFVPNLNNNIIDSLCEIVKQSERDLQNLNAKIFFEKKRLQIKSHKMVTTDTSHLPITSFKTDILDSLKQKPKFDYNKIFIQNETTFMRYELINQLKNIQINMNPNLSANQLYFLKNFLKTKPFSIIQCDKNIGTAIVSNDLLKKLCSGHLQDDKIYKKLNCDPLNEVNNKIESILNSLSINGSLNFNVKLLITRQSKLGKFRILCKLHKNKFGIRPIINNCAHPTSQICKFIDLLIKPRLMETPSYLKDSQHLLQKCNELKIEYTNIYLYSMDFESLYTNIDKLDACNRITEYMTSYLNEDYIQPFALYTLLLIIFENNVFAYNNTFYVQINGLAMGCICGPSVASLYVYILEKHWLSINHPILYGRFIDDIFMVTDVKLNEDIFSKNFLNLNLNIVHEKKINFLDLSISFNTIIRKLEFSLYVKPTNTFSYLHTESNHPHFIFKNIPKSLFIRIRRICTNDIDYYFFTRKLILQLLSRGYDYKNLFSIQLCIGNIQRNSLLNYKNKTISFKNCNSFLMSNEYNKYIANKSDLFKNSFHNSTHKYTWLNNYKIKFYFLISFNIFSLLIHNRSLNNNSINFTKKCNCQDCQVCYFINQNSYIFLKKGFIIPIKNNCDCNSIGIIYIIRCSLCNIFYVGQTKRSAKERIKEHLTSINKFIPFVRFTSEIGMHFNLRHHNYINHFSFYIFKKNIEDLDKRLSIETDIIHIINENNPPIINLTIPSKSKIKYFSFI